MGCTGPTPKYKYNKAYRSISFTSKNIRSQKEIQDVYLVNVDTIKNFIEILNNCDFLKKLKLGKDSIIDELEGTLLKKLEKYKIEENIEIIEVKHDNFDQMKQKEFIFVDKDFLENMEINPQENMNKKVTLKKNEKSNDVKREMNIELINKDEKIIYEIKEERDEIYKFVERLNESLSINNVSYFKNDKDIEFDPENNVDLRKPKNKEINKSNKILNDNKIQDNNNEITYLIKKEGNENKSYINNNYNENYNENDNENDLSNDNLLKIDNEEINITQKKEEAKAQVAKLDQIIYDIFMSLKNLNEQKDIIMNTIKEKLNSLKMENELEEKENIDIINNIKQSIIYFLTIFNNEEINYVQKGINPFSFNQVIITQCDNCNKPINENKTVDYVKLVANRRCDNLNDCLNIKYSENCECGNNIKANLKFESTPDILILKFDKPKDNKKYLSYKLVEENIDLKNRVLQMNNTESFKYKLIKALYLHDAQDDNQLYVDISNEEKNNYIPYIIIYQRINNI